MGHNCVEGPDTPAVAASRCREQMNSTRGRSGWCHRTPLLCPTSAGSLTNQSSGRKLAAGARSPAGPVKISLPGSRRHFSSADTIWQRRVTWPRDMSWRHRVTCRDVTAWHVVTSRATPFVTSPLITRHPGHGRHGLTDWQKDQNCTEIYRHRSGGPETRDQGESAAAHTEGLGLPM